MILQRAAMSVLLILATTTLLLCCAAHVGSTATPPAEPSYSYVSPDFSVQETGDCVDGSRVWIYQPAVIKPGGADVVVYLHGYSAAYPLIYQGHVEHLVKQGNYVIFPQFQEGFCTPGQEDFMTGLSQFFGRASPSNWAEQAVIQVENTLADLPNYNNVYLFGHSLGGAFGMLWGDLMDPSLIAAAVLASPQPAGFGAIPGFVTTLLPFLFGDDIDVPAAAPQTTFPVVVLHGEDDTVAPLEDILPSYEALGSSEKALYQARSDAHGTPALSANHVAPTSSLVLLNDINALDWLYFWSALDEVMAGIPVAGLTFDLGAWSDGVTVKPIQQLQL